MKHTLVLPIQLLSKNERDRLHPRRRSALRLSYQSIIELTHPRRHDTPRQRQLVTVTRLMGVHERPLDLQNIGAGSAVELIDALKQLGWFVDDSPRWLEPRFRQKRNDQDPGPSCLVEIEVMTPKKGRTKT